MLYFLSYTYAQASAIFTRRDWFSIGKHKKCQLVIWLGQNGLGYQSATKYVRSHCHWLQNDHKAEWQTGSDQKSEMILSMWAAIWGSRCGSGLCLSFQVCSSTPAITWNCSLPGLPFTFEQVAPGSAPGTGGPHFWTWTWAFHQEPDHSFANLSHELDLDLGGEPRNLCSSDAEGEPHQADHQTVSSWVWGL